MHYISPTTAENDSVDSHETQW